jgi:hypothetical protein
MDAEKPPLDGSSTKATRNDRSTNVFYRVCMERCCECLATLQSRNKAIVIHEFMNLCWECFTVAFNVTDIACDILGEVIDLDPCIY